MNENKYLIEDATNSEEMSELITTLNNECLIIRQYLEAKDKYSSFKSSYKNIGIDLNEDATANF